MSFFKFDEENVNTGFELVVEGKYETVITNAVAGKTQNGKDKLAVDFEIRSDLPQNHQGAKILYNMFTFEHEVSMKIVNSLLKACGFSNNHIFTSADKTITSELISISALRMGKQMLSQQRVSIH